MSKLAAPPPTLSSTRSGSIRRRAEFRTTSDPAAGSPTVTRIGSTVTSTSSSVLPTRNNTPIAKDNGARGRDPHSLTPAQLPARNPPGDAQARNHPTGRGNAPSQFSERASHSLQHGCSLLLGLRPCSARAGSPRRARGATIESTVVPANSASGSRMRRWLSTGAASCLMSSGKT